jgi:hypothetical protein
MAMRIDEFIWPDERIEHIARHGINPMNKSKLPKIDSLQELAEFWDKHDLTDFDGELEEVAEPVFMRGGSMTVPLEASEAEFMSPGGADQP